MVGVLVGLEAGLVVPCIQTHLQPHGHFNFRLLLSVGWRGANAPDPDLDLPRLFAPVQGTA